MWKKRLVLILCILLAVSWCPKALAATEADLELSVAAQYDAYAKSIFRKDAADDTIEVMLKQALYGNGRSLHFTEKNPVAAALYESNLFRTFLIEALSIGSQVMLDSKLTQGLFGTAGLAWHDFALEYRVSQYHYNDTTDTTDDQASDRYVPQTFYYGAKNDCDKAMMLVVGGCNVRIRMHLLETDFESASYRVDIQVSDEFEFDGNYESADKMGFNTTFSKLISALGPLLGMDEFFWDCTTGFEITVPLVYRCAHQTGDYRWEHNGTDFTAVSGEGLTVVQAHRIDETTNDGTAYHYFQLENPIRLHHSVPWVLEFQQQGSSGFMLGPDLTWSTGAPYFLRTADHMLVGHYDPSEEQKGRHQYGFEITSLGYSYKQWHTFRIENRIAEDGSNMLWLLIDGQELGPMTHYYYNPTFVNTDMETTDTWACGVDFTIEYIGGTSFPIRGQFGYIAVWQDGPGNPHDPFKPGSTAPTCTKPGYATKTCIYCGYTSALENTPTLGHTESSLPGTSATCTEAGLTDGAKCGVCGEILKAQETVPPVGHKEATIPGAQASCTEEGKTEGAKCSVCGEILKAQETVPPVGHKEAPIPGAQASCTEEGKTEGAKCSVCGEILKAQEAIPSLGHSYQKGYCTQCGEQDPGFLKGDTDFDGVLTYQDALLILRASINLEECDVALCDTDGDGCLTYQDALYVLRTSIGL